MHVTETLEAIQKLSIAQKREHFHQINSIPYIYQFPRHFDLDFMKLFYSPCLLRCGFEHAGRLLRWSDCPVVAPEHRHHHDIKGSQLFDDDDDAVDAFDDDDDDFDDDDGWSPAENIACPLQGGSRGRICVG